VHLDIDGDNASDPVDRADIVQVTWILPESTPARAGGVGYVDSASGNNVVGFAFSATSSTEAGVNGQCILGDGEANVLLLCLNALVVTRTGTHLTMFGIAWINGQFDAYRVDADDLGPVFSGADTFRIRLFNSSYTASGVVLGGDVIVR
jgi:hypothetical protein